MLLLIFLYTVLASTFTLTKMLLAFLPPIFLTAIRMTIAGPLLLMIWKLTQPKSKSFQVKDFGTLLFLSMIHILIPFVTEFTAMQTIAPSCAALMFNLSPFFTALFSFIYFGETMTPKKWLGFIIGFSSIGWFVQAQSAEFACFDFQMPYILMLIAVTSCSLAWVYFRKLVQQGYSSIQINGFAMMLAGLQAFVVSALVEGPIVFPLDKLGQFLFLLCLIILLANLTFYNLYGYLLKKYTATLLAFIGCVTPLITALFDYVFLGIAVDATFMITLVVVSSGIYLFYQEELRQGYIAK